MHTNEPFLTWLEESDYSPEYIAEVKAEYLRQHEARSDVEPLLARSCVNVCPDGSPGSPCWPSCETDPTAVERIVADREAADPAEVAALKQIAVVNASLHRTAEDDLTRTTAERDALAEVVREAALETYKPEGAEVIVSTVIRLKQEATSARAEVAALRERLVAVEALADRWEQKANRYEPMLKLRAALAQPAPTNAGGRDE